MDKKRTQRVLGILIIIALIIILFPLLFGKNENSTPSETVIPATPEQPNNQTRADSLNGDTANNEANLDLSETNNASVYPPDVQEQDEANLEVTSDLVEESNEAVTPSPTLQTSNKANSPDLVTTTSESSVVKIKSEKIIPANELKELSKDKIVTVVTEETSKSSSSKTKKNASVNMANSDNVKLNDKAWAIQMGSFKNKENARSLADKLRVAGFKAFTKEIKLANGTIQTRVFIGPEFKESTALKLSANVQQALNLHGIVVPYKPLAL